MVSLFENIYPDKRRIFTNQLQTTLALSQQDLFSGLVEIVYSPKDKVILLFNSGKIVCGYQSKADTLERYAPSNISPLLYSQGEGEIRVCPLSQRFLPAVKTLIEHDRNSGEVPSNADLLPSVIQQQQASPEPTLIHVRWPSAEAFAFLPGNNFPARQYVFVTADRLSDSAAAVSMFSHWSEPECIISLYPGEPDMQAWNENFLQLGFSLLVEQIMQRYDELVGHSLSRKLEDTLNRFSQAQAWNIAVTDNTVDDIQVFDAIPDAATAYRTILAVASRQMSAVIGARLFDEAIHTGLDRLNGNLRQAIEHHALVSSLQVAR